VSLINTAGATGVGLCGKDARLLTARPAPNAADLGFVGEVSSVNPAILRPILADGHIPVIASIADDQSGQVMLLNIINPQLFSDLFFFLEL
jgi:acetylglutamate kinase